MAVLRLMLSVNVLPPQYKVSIILSIPACNRYALVVRCFRDPWRNPYSACPRAIGNWQRRDVQRRAENLRREPDALQPGPHRLHIGCGYRIH